MGEGCLPNSLITYYIGGFAIIFGTFHDNGFCRKVQTKSKCHFKLFGKYWDSFQAIL